MQIQFPKAPMQLTLEADTMAVVLEALSNMPYRTAANPIAIIAQQVAAQVAAEAKANAEQPAAPGSVQGSNDSTLDAMLANKTN